MMNTAPIIARIWDYGWLCHDQVELPKQSSDALLVAAYVASSCFHTCFLPTDKPETGLHGPFHASQISADDFVAHDQLSLEPYIKELLFSKEWESPASADQFAAVLRLLSEPFAGGARCYVLRRTETERECQHDWGFVFVVFREILFVDDRRTSIDRYVIGYD